MVHKVHLRLIYLALLSKISLESHTVTEHICTGKSKSLLLKKKNPNRNDIDTIVSIIKYNAKRIINLLHVLIYLSGQIIQVFLHSLYQLQVQITAVKKEHRLQFNTSQNLCSMKCLPANHLGFFFPSVTLYLLKLSHVHY